MSIQERLSILPSPDFVCKRERKDIPFSKCLFPERMTQVASTGMQHVVTSLFCWLPRDNKTVHNTRVPNSATVAPVGATLRMRQNRLVTYLRKRSIQKGPGCRHAAGPFCMLAALPTHPLDQSSFSPRVACRLVDPATGPVARRCSAALATRISSQRPIGDQTI